MARTSAAPRHPPRPPGPGADRAGRVLPALEHDRALGQARRGLRLDAADGPFAAGDGPLVTGPTLALVMAMAGRTAYLDELSGEGAPELRERCADLK
nr:hypothetical protein GCM10025732_39520 [Glycomyces mayteni]